MLLYPTGISSEVGLIYFALPYIKVKTAAICEFRYIFITLYVYLIEKIEFVAEIWEVLYKDAQHMEFLFW